LPFFLPVCRNESALPSTRAHFQAPTPGLEGALFILAQDVARLDPLGSAGKQLPGNDNGAANKNPEAPPSPERTVEKSLVTT
jgi:hypothetical protein